MASMSTDTLAVPLDHDLKERLQRLAADTDRSEAEIAAEAIADFLAVQEWQIAGIEEALASIERGETVPHDKVADWVRSWGTEDEKPPPTR
jgi:RHH-type transcriptional regulator, rel operon repressor / antitoxin RelB